MSVYKKILILLFSSFVGIIANPEMPFASDTVEVTDIFGAVETVIVKEEKTSWNVVEPVTVKAAPAPSHPNVFKKEYSQPLPANRINIAGRSLEVVDVDNTAVDSGNHVNRYNEKFLYGHNSAGVFGVLYNVHEGDIFSLAKNGVTTNYRVQAVVVYEKVDGYTLGFNGQNVKMSAVARARHNGVSYDLSLMTCYGTSYGNGDASHRLVLFASAF